MADVYLRSTSSGGTQAGTSWANAYLTFAAAATGAGAGGKIYVSQAHAEAAATFVISTVSAGNPLQVICCDDTSGEPPVTLSTGATFESTSSYLVLSGDYYFYGCHFKASTSSSADSSYGLNGNGHLEFENCKISMYGSTNSSISVGPKAGTATHGEALFKGCSFRFGAVGQRIYPNRGRATFIDCIIPDSRDSGATPTTLFLMDASYGDGGAPNIQMIGCDLSLMGSGKTIFGNSNNPGTCYLIDCKLGASVTLYGTAADAASGELYLKNTGSANNNYQYAVRKYMGSIDIDTAQYITLTSEAGASDGDIGYSWKMAGNANAKLNAPLRSEWIYMRYPTTGAAKTATIEILYDGAANLTDREVWMEIGVLTDSGSPKAGFTDDRCGLLTAAADQDAGIGITHWTKGTAGTGWISQKLVSPSFTPQKKGYVMARICVAANKTIYVNPNIVIA